MVKFPWRRQRRVLLYGSVDERDVTAVQPWVAEFVELALEDGWHFVTRNGTVDPQHATIPWAHEDRCPIDDFVIDAIATEGPGLGCDLSSCLRSVVSESRPGLRDVGQARVVATRGRLGVYSKLLEEAHVVVLIGGLDGVTRMAFSAYGSGHPMIPLSIVDGTAKEIAEAVYSPLVPGTYFQRVGYADVGNLRRSDLEPAAVLSIVKRYRRSELWFSVRELLGRRMRAAEFGSILWNKWERFATSLFRVVVVVGAGLLFGLIAWGAITGIWHALEDLVERLT